MGYLFFIYQRWFTVREDTNELVLGSLQIDYLYISREGLIELANCSSMSSSQNSHQITK